MKQLKILLLASMVTLFTTYANAVNMAPIISYLLSDTVTATPQEIAIDKIKAYADNQVNPIPTVEDYINAGVTGVTAENIDNTNLMIASLTIEDVDTLEEIQALIDAQLANTIPTANAGADKSVLVSATVTLDGSRSSDDDNDTLTYSWNFITMPAESNASLSDDTVVNPNFTADLTGTYVLSLVVNDGIVDSIEDNVTITVSDYDMVGILDTTFNMKLDTTFNSDGTVVHHNAAGGDGTDDGQAIVVDSAGNLYVTGKSFEYTLGAVSWDMVIWKYTSDGVLDSTFGTDGIVIYHHHEDVVGNAIAVDSSGNLYVTGYINSPQHDINSDDMVIWKYNSDGVLDSTFSRDGIVVHDGAAGELDENDVGKAIALDSTGDIYVTGYSTNSAGDRDMVIWKYDSNGSLDSTFGTGGIEVRHNVAGGEGSDEGHAIVLDSSDNVYVSGASINSAGNYDMVIWKYTNTGILDSTFGTGGIAVHNSGVDEDDDDFGVAILLDSSGNVYVTGHNFNIVDGWIYSDMVIWKYTSAGILDSTFGADGIVVHNGAAGGNKDDRGYEITLDIQGNNVYITGYSRNSTGSDDMVIWKYTNSGVLDSTFGTDGIVVHHNAAGGDGHDYGQGITLDSVGSVYVTGFSQNSAGDFDMTIWKYTGDGIVVHRDAAGGEGDEYGLAIARDSSRNIYVAGYSPNSAGDADMVIWKFTGQGILYSTFGTDGIVVHHNAAGGEGSDYGYAMAPDSSGNIYVTGSSRNSAGNADMVIWKYDSNGSLDSSFGTDGIVVHNSAAGGNDRDQGDAIVLDSSENVYVTGNSRNSAGDLDMVIWKYDSNGSLDSTFGTGGIVVHNGAAGGNDLDTGNAMVLDSSGNIYVTGYSDNSARDLDMVIWKYTNSGVLDNTFGTGGIVVHHNAAGGESGDRGLDITLDSLGNVYVSGYSTNTNSSDDYDMVIWKYTSDGTLDNTFGTGGIVVHRNAAGGDYMDFGYAIALDSFGNIYVSGQSYNSEGDYDMVIWKYTNSGVLYTTFGTDGIVIHNNAAGGNDRDRGYAMALDSSGNNIYVTGASDNSAGDLDMVIWKYR